VTKENKGEGQGGKYKMKSTNRGTRTKKGEDEKQRKIEISKEIEKKEENRDVKSKEEGDRKEEMRKEIEERLKEVGKEINKEKEIRNKEEKMLEVRIRLVEEKFQRLDYEIKDLRQAREREDAGSEARGKGSSRASSGGRGSRYSIWTEKSEEALSQIEVGKIKKILTEKEREKRKNNIVIKGLGNVLEKDVDKEVRKILWQKLGVKRNYKVWSRNGTVIVVKMENEEEKNEIMKNKHKLKGKRIYIENDLTWEERRIQERINKWVKERKDEKEVIKIGRGRIRINGIWKYWEEIEKAEEEEKDETKRRGRGEDIERRYIRNMRDAEEEEGETTRT